MNRTAAHWLGRALMAAAAVVMIGCADDTTLGPDRGPAIQFAASSTSTESDMVAWGADLESAFRNVDPGVCTNLQPPTGTKLAYHVYASGVQIYHWNGTGWSFDGPSALLFADAAGNGVVGKHYGGPAWESMSGGKVYGAVLQRCTVDPNAVPWLLLAAQPDGGPGIFQRIAFIQRVNTTGGNAPSTPGTVTGQVAEIPYTAEYLFYRMQ